MDERDCRTTIVIVIKSESNVKGPCCPCLVSLFVASYVKGAGNKDINRGCDRGCTHLMPHFYIAVRTF